MEKNQKKYECTTNDKINVNARKRRKTDEFYFWIIRNLRSRVVLMHHTFPELGHSIHFRAVNLDVTHYSFYLKEVGMLL
jgi:hypothetical protein